MMNQTDQDLLELAAKAAGIDGKFLADAEGGSIVYWVKPQYIDQPSSPVFWRPQHDDGQALRLACDLGLRVYPVARTVSGAACSAVGSATCERLSEVADLSLVDVRMATRRAIVMAAATIGEKME